MSVDPAPAQQAYNHSARHIAAHAEAGRRVAILCQGDPLFYGSFSYLFDRLAERFAIEIVPGVSSMHAAGAACQLPLVGRNDALSVLPAPLPEDLLLQRLREGGAAVIIKLGRHFEKVSRVLALTGRLETARYIERATLASERILPLHKVEPERVPYFSIILAPAPSRRTG